MITRLLRQLFALAALVALVVGSPFVLWKYGRGLLPTELPTPAQAWEILTSPDDGAVFIGFAVLVGVIAWMVVTVCILVELIAQLANRPAIRLPGLRLPQKMASSLITVALAGAITFAGATTANAGQPTSLPPLSQVVGGSAAPAAMAYPVAASSSASVKFASENSYSAAVPAVTATATAAPVWVVAKGDTLWSIADQSLGDPLRYTEIATLNQGVQQVDGKIFTSGEWLETGWQLQLPADANISSAPRTGEVVVVEPGDTLSALSQEYLGDADRYPELAAANSLADPNELSIGQVLLIPDQPTADEVPAGGTTVRAPSQPVAPDPPATSTQQAADEAAQQTAAAEQAAMVAVQQAAIDQAAADAADLVAQQATADAADQEVIAEMTRPVSLAGPSSAPAISAQPAAANAASGESPALPGSAPWWAAALAAAGAGLLAGGAYKTLLQLRRRQGRRRRPGHIMKATPPELIPMERILLSAESVGLSDASFLDEALRALVTSLKATDQPLPEIIAARLSSLAVELVLTRPAAAPPSPWTGNGDGTRWELARSEHSPLSAQDRLQRVAPYPALVSVGHTPSGDSWLLDLEFLGNVRFTGDPVRCQDLARHVAAELSHNTWSEMLQVTLLGWGKELAELSPGRLVVTQDWGRVLNAAAAQADAVTGSPVPVLAGRQGNISLDAWDTKVLIIDPAGADSSDQLAALMTSLGVGPDRLTVAVVMTGEADSPAAAGFEVHINTDGSLQIPALGLELVAEQLPLSEAVQLCELLAFAGQAQDHKAGPSVGDNTWDEHADELGALVAMPGVTFERNPSPVRLAGQEHQSSLLPLPTREYEENTAATLEDLTSLSPTVTVQARQQIEISVAALDADLVDWNDPACPRPRVTLLGPVQVRAQGWNEQDKPQRDLRAELVTYLALHPRGVTVDQYATTLWPQEPDILTGGPDQTPKGKVRKYISGARLWLGTNPATGKEYLPRETGRSGAVYRIEQALVDAELFRELRIRGAARGTEGISDLLAALQLVTGEPLSQTRREGYAGIGVNIKSTYVAMISDTAHVVATHYLQTGHPELAAQASQVALLAGSFDDITFLDLIFACRAAGDEVGEQQHLRELLTINEAIEEVDLPPRTLAILDGRLKSG